MQLFLIRHAQSANNAKPESQRVEDPGLTELGREQARRLEEWIPKLKLTRIFTSPFRRTLETATPLRRATSLDLEIRVDLHERGGCYRGHLPENIVGRPGMNGEEIQKGFPGVTIAEPIDERGWWASKPHESDADARERAARLLERTCEEFADTSERVGYVMHADFKLLFLRHLHVEPLETPYNTSISLIEISRRECRLADFNAVDHLPSDFMTR